MSLYGISLIWLTTMQLYGMSLVWQRKRKTYIWDVSIISIRCFYHLHKLKFPNIEESKHCHATLISSAAKARKPYWCLIDHEQKKLMLQCVLIILRRKIGFVIQSIIWWPTPTRQFTFKERICHCASWKWGMKGILVVATMHHCY